MNRKLKLHSWEYFKENHYIDGQGRVKKYKTSKETTYLTKEIVDVHLYKTHYRFPGPYTIEIDDSNARGRIQERRVLSWMIDEVITEESHPEYFI